MKAIKLLTFLVLPLVMEVMVSCSNDSIPVTASSMTATAIQVEKAESLNDLVLDYAGKFADYMLFITNNDLKDSVYSIPSSSTLAVTIYGVTIHMDKKERKKYPKNIQLDFGTSGVTLGPGNVFKGEIHIKESGDMSVPSSSRTYVFSNLQVNSQELKGINTITYLGLNTDLNPHWKVESNDTILSANEGFLTWQSERSRTCIERKNLSDSSSVEEVLLRTIGNSQADSGNKRSLMYWTDKYMVSGFSKGENEKSAAYHILIDEANPLIIGEGFPFYTKGKEIMKQEDDTQVIDFGNGAKDNRLTSTLYGVSKDFYMEEE